MTHEEPIKKLKDILEEVTETDDSVCYVTSDDTDTLKAAIKALEIQPCEDCVGREDAINTAIEAIDEWDGGCNINRTTMICKAIKNLPSVTPSRPRGNWIEWTDDYKDYVTCPSCGYGEEGEVLLKDKTPFCPICGADMRESEE